MSLDIVPFSPPTFSPLQVPLLSGMQQPTARLAEQ
jgi:hypothetical protein